MPLNSKTNLKLIDAICEGPIEGIVNLWKGVFLNETKVTIRQVKPQEPNQPTVVVQQKQGSKDQGSFGESSLFSNATTTVQPVALQVGENYSETVDENNRVTPGNRHYGAGQVVQQIQDPEVDFIKLVFTIPKLFCVAPEGLARGQLFFAQIKLRITIQDRGENYRQIDIAAIGTDQKNVIRGISTSEYQFETQEIDLTDFEAPANVKVEKLEFSDPENAFEIKISDLEKLPDNTPLADKRADTIIWSSIILGKRIRTTYPYTALAFLSIDSEEYGTLPARAYDVKGKKVKIPSNAVVREDGSLQFDPAEIPFDGRLKEGLFYTTCPVCCFYDMATNNRYGAGDFIDGSRLSWIDLIDIARYCNEIIDTPDGGKEPRFAINTVIGSQAEAYNVMQDMASVFRGMLFWKADTVQVAADHGELENGNVDAVHVFSNSNVVNGTFAYSGSSLKTRSTRVRVRYSDPDNFYKPNFIIIEDQVLIKKYGIQERNIVAFGCTSKHQAQRMGRWVMLSEKFHDETITFSVGLEGLNVLPGQMFEVSDEMRLGTRLAGRIVGASLGFVDLDQTATLPTGSNNKLTVVMPDGSVETRDIAGVSGVRVTLTSNFTQVPADDALFAIRNDAARLTKYRCLSIAEGDDGIYSITGVRHVDGIYRAIEDPDFKLELPPPFFWGDTPDTPRDPQIRFQQIDDGRNTTIRGTISWTRGLTGPVLYFKAEYKIGEGGNWIAVETANNSIDIDKGLIPGKRLYAQIKAVGPAPDYKQSGYATVSKIISSDDRDGIVPPPNPEGLSIEVINSEQVVLRWSVEIDGQNVEGFLAHIRHSSKTDGSGTWPNSVLLRKVEARTGSAILPLLNGEYFVKFINEQRQQSIRAVSVVLNVPEAQPRFNYEVMREDASPGEFPGQKNNVYYSDYFDGLLFDGDASFDAIPLLGSSGGLPGLVGDIDDYFGTQALSGEYIFQKTVDLGAKYSVRLLRTLSVRGLYKSDLIDDRTELIDTWSDFDGEIPDSVNVEMYFRTIDVGDTKSVMLHEDGDKIQLEDGDNIQQQSDLVFGDWIPLESSAYAGRSFQFKAVLTSDHEDQTPLIDELGVTVELERRTENSGQIRSGYGTKSITFEHPFYIDADTAVSVGITASNMQEGDYFEMTEPTSTGFDITFKGTFDGDVFVDRFFSYTAIGYGTGQT